MEEAVKTGRVRLMDELRGLNILVMAAYHAAYDIVYIFGADVPAFTRPVMAVVQPMIAGLFIFISGISCRYSRSNVKRGVVTLGIGVGISLVTWLFIRDQMIWFGILHFLGTCMILFGVLRPVFDKLPPAVGLAVSALLWFCLKDVPAGLIGPSFLPQIALPSGLYNHRWLLPIGIGGAGADYFPLLPWLFLFLAGAYTGVWFARGRMPAALYRSRLPWFAVIGRHTLVIYLLHQPVIYGLLWLYFS